MTSAVDTAPVLDVEALTHTYGSGSTRHLALNDITFDVAQGELVSIVGPSGCGKTTLLRAIAGLHGPDRGPARLGRRPDHGRSPTGWRWCSRTTAARSFRGSRCKTTSGSPCGACACPPRKCRRASPRHWVPSVSRASRPYPTQLSGGMPQRVAIARALAYRPKILLMDEPFASIDAQTREELEDLVLEVRDHFNMTILFVTHDIDESVYLAGSGGRALQAADGRADHLRDRSGSSTRPDLHQRGPRRSSICGGKWLDSSAMRRRAGCRTTPSRRSSASPAPAWISACTARVWSSPAPPAGSVGRPFARSSRRVPTSSASTALCLAMPPSWAPTPSSPR